MNRKDGRGCIYFITDGTGCVKIGKSNDLAKYRLYSLQTGNPRPLTILISITMSKDVLSKAENALHSLFAEYRITNTIVSEWFTNGDIIAEYAKKITSNDINIMLSKYGFPNNDESRENWLNYKRSRYTRGIYERS